MSTMTSTPMKTRNHVIDLMKFLAAILITSCHMGMLYPAKFRVLATGGAIGDALFFFCSGYLLMMGRKADFFNWYKRRINRIFPTIFAIALTSIIVFGEDPTLKHVILEGGGWFVQAIFVFYAIYWFVKAYLSDKMWIAYLIVSVMIVVWSVLGGEKDIFLLGTHAHYMRWPCFFLIMLIGGSVYNYEQIQGERKDRFGLWFYLGILAVLLLMYRGFQWLEGPFPILWKCQAFILLPLIGIVLTVYKICSNAWVQRIYLNKYVHWPVYYISACCLEVYLCQWWCFGIGTRLMHLFPLNVIVTFLVIFVVAYLVKVFSNFLSQTFKTEPYDWRKMIVL